jgi:colanic acid biosynthesis glycosyl transferase WcaI
MISKIKKIKHLIWVQDLWPETLLDLKILKKGTVYSILKKIVNYIFKNCDIIFVQSKEFIEIIQKNYKLKNIIYLPNWCEDIFFNNKSKFFFKKTKDQFDIVFTGNIGKAQDFKNIIKAANNLKKYTNFYWHIFGSGSELESSKKKIRLLKLENNFIFYGRRPLDTMPSILSAADILIITMIKSRFLNKTIPGKFQTYLSAKKPIVGMIDGITKDIINRYKLGLASGSEDYKDFAKNIVSVYEQKSKINIYKINSHNYFKKNYSKKKILDNLEKIIFKKYYDKF